jgi:hypothetical protein
VLFFFDQTPGGVFCPGRLNVRALPSLPDAMYFEGESFSKEDKSITYTKVLDNDDENDNDDVMMIMMKVHTYNRVQIGGIFFFSSWYY